MKKAGFRVKSLEFRIFVLSVFIIFYTLYPNPYFLSPIPYLFGAFKDPGWGARPLGMAGAFTAVSDDSNAVLFNPAGLNQIYLNQFDFMYGKPFVGLEGVDIDYYLMTGALNISHKFKLGIGYTNFTTKDLYREDTALISFSYAPKLTGFSESIGITLKWLYHGFVPDEYTKKDIVFSKITDKSAFGLDAGITAKFFDRLKFGFSAKDINQPDVGLKDKDLVPYTLNVGFAYIHTIQIGKLTYAIDASLRNKEYNINLGVESFLLGESLGVRAGGNLTEIAIGATYKFNISPSLSTEVTYAFIWPIYVQETYGTHRLSLGIRF